MLVTTESCKVARGIISHILTSQPACPDPADREETAYVTPAAVMKRTADIIKAARQRKGYNQSELARKLRISPQAVQKWENGETVPRPARLLALLQVLDVTDEELGKMDDQTRALLAQARMNGKEQSNASFMEPVRVWDDDTPLDDDEVELPLLKEVELSAGGGRTMVQQSSKAKLRFGKQTLRNHNVQFDQAVCVVVHGNSMEPVLPHGSTVAVNQADRIVIDGKIYALNQDGQLRVKVLYRLPGGGVRLRSFNRDDHMDEDYSLDDMEERNISIIGRVFWSATFH